jgi:hypothetical protein
LILLLRGFMSGDTSIPMGFTGRALLSPFAINYLISSERQEVRAKEECPFLETLLWGYEFFESAEKGLGHRIVTPIRFVARMFFTHACGRYLAPIGLCYHVALAILTVAINGREAASRYKTAIKQDLYTMLFFQLTAYCFRSVPFNERLSKCVYFGWSTLHPRSAIDAVADAVTMVWHSALLLGPEWIYASNYISIASLFDTESMSGRYLSLTLRHKLGAVNHDGTLLPVNIPSLTLEEENGLLSPCDYFQLSLGTAEKCFLGAVNEVADELGLMLQVTFPLNGYEVAKQLRRHAGTLTQPHEKLNMLIEYAEEQQRVLDILNPLVHAYGHRVVFEALFNADNSLMAKIIATAILTASLPNLSSLQREIYFKTLYGRQYCSEEELKFLDDLSSVKSELLTNQVAKDFLERLKHAHINIKRANESEFIGFRVGILLAPVFKLTVPCTREEIKRKYNEYSLKIHFDKLPVGTPQDAVEAHKILFQLLCSTYELLVPKKEAKVTETVQSPSSGVSYDRLRTILHPFAAEIIDFQDDEGNTYSLPAIPIEGVPDYTHNDLLGNVTAIKFWHRLNRLLKDTGEPYTIKQIAEVLELPDGYTEDDVKNRVLEYATQIHPNVLGENALKDEKYILHASLTDLLFEFQSALLIEL